VTVLETFTRINNSYQQLVSTTQSWLLESRRTLGVVLAECPQLPRHAQKKNACSKQLKHVLVNCRNGLHGISTLSDFSRDAKRRALKR
jgi:hypothetical protein